VRYVLDASVAVAALRSVEPGHAQALRRCMPLFVGTDRAVVPAIFEHRDYSVQFWKMNVTATGHAASVGQFTVAAIRPGAIGGVSIVLKVS
jgi:hypothetical protein